MRSKRSGTNSSGSFSSRQPPRMKRTHNEASTDAAAAGLEPLAAQMFYDSLSQGQASYLEAPAAADHPMAMECAPVSDMSFSTALDAPVEAQPWRKLPTCHGAMLLGGQSHTVEAQGQRVCPACYTACRKAPFVVPAERVRMLSELIGVWSKAREFYTRWEVASGLTVYVRRYPGARIPPRSVFAPPPREVTTTRPTTLQPPRRARPPRLSPHHPEGRRGPTTLHPSRPPLAPATPPSDPRLPPSPPLFAPHRRSGGRPGRQPLAGALPLGAGRAARRPLARCDGAHPPHRRERLVHDVLQHGQSGRLGEPIAGHHQLPREHLKA